jgi:hypothetical protein
MSHVSEENTYGFFLTKIQWHASAVDCSEHAHTPWLIGFDKKNIKLIGL